MADPYGVGWVSFSPFSISENWSSLGNAGCNRNLGTHSLLFILQKTLKITPGLNVILCFWKELSFPAGGRRTRVYIHEERK